MHQLGLLTAIGVLFFFRTDEPRRSCTTEDETKKRYFSHHVSAINRDQSSSADSDSVWHPHKK